MVELKNLCRVWKLNETRGFWKLNPLKEDIVNALLEYREVVLQLPRQPVKPSATRPSRLDDKPEKKDSRSSRTSDGDERREYGRA